jgi:hypothetical protein
MRAMSKWCLVVIAACTSSKYEPPPPPAAPAPLAEFADHLARVDLEMVAGDIDDAAKASSYAAVAPKVADALLAAWPKIEGQELVYATRLGTLRGDGKSPGNCVECMVFGRTMDALAPADARLTAAWAALKPRLAAAEQTAYDTEASDQRPRVTVWADGDDRDQVVSSALVMDCVMTALRARFPDRKFISAWAEPDHGVAAIQLDTTIASDDYVNSRTHEKATSLASGVHLTLHPQGFDMKPVEVAVSVTSPTEIKSDLNVAPTMEVTRTGMSQLDQLRDRACTKVAAALEPAPAPNRARHARR